MGSGVGVIGTTKGAAVIARAMALALAFLLSAAIPALADDDFDLGEVDPELPAKIKQWNADCLSCHSQQGLINPPRKGMDMVLLAKLLTDQAGFERGDHAKMACKDCHTEDYVPYPHLPNAIKKIKTCESCHQQPAKTIGPEFKASIHFKDHSDKFTCRSCHEPHTMRTGSKLGSARGAAQEDNRLCLTCHDDDKRYSALKADKKRADMGEAHDWLPETALHMGQVRCVDCHTPVGDVTMSHDVQVKDKAVRRCETCHAADTELTKRLYKRMARDNPEDRAGFINAALLDEIYVIGAHRNAWLEWSALAALTLTAAAVAGRALWRRRQRRK